MAQEMIQKGRFTAAIDGDFVVFLIGMRINAPLQAHKWGPVFMSMPRMLRELRKNEQAGLLHCEMFFGRTMLMVQYWRSLEQLLDYAVNKDMQHLPAWHAYYKAAKDGSVGIWHETYRVTAGRHESLYVNMPRFGLGAAGDIFEATGARHSARGRFGQTA